MALFNGKKKRVWKLRLPAMEESVLFSFILPLVWILRKYLKEIQDSIAK